MKQDYSHVRLSDGPGQINKAFRSLLSTPDFIRTHQLWKGFFDYQWVLIFSVIVAAIFTYTLYSDIHSYFVPSIEENLEIEIPTDGPEEGIKTIEKSLEGVPQAAEAGLHDAKEKLVETKSKLGNDHKQKITNHFFLEV